VPKGYRSGHGSKLAAFALAIAVIGCSKQSAPPTLAAEPLLKIVHSQRPTDDGVIYLAAGTTSADGQIYRVSIGAGHISQLTRLPTNREGVSTMSAAGGWVVFSSALLGTDHPYRANQDGTYVPLTPDPGAAPVVSQYGDVAWASAGGGHFQIHVKRADDSRDEVVFTSRKPVVAGAWLARNELALFSGGEGGQIQFLSLRARKINRVISVPAEVTGWHFAASSDRAFAVGDGNEEVLIKSDGSTVSLPARWRPLAFSPDSRTILIYKPSGTGANDLGFVSVASPDRVALWARLRLATLLGGAWVPM
jgi:hypothetical protein